MIGSAADGEEKVSISNILKVAGHTAADVTDASSFEISASATGASNGSCDSTTREEDSEETYVSGDRCSVNGSFLCESVESDDDKDDLLDSAIDSTGFVGSASVVALILADCGNMISSSVSTAPEAVEIGRNGDNTEEFVSSKNDRCFRVGDDPGDETRGAKASSSE